MNPSGNESAAQMSHGSRASWAGARVWRGLWPGAMGWLILAAYVVLLVCRALFSRADIGEAGIGVWELQNEQRLIAWIGGLVLNALGESAYFIGVGFLAALAVPRGSGRLSRLRSGFLALGIAGVLTVLVCLVGTVGPWRPAAAVGWVLPLLGGCLGVWAGTAWRRGWRARLWLLPKVGLLVALLGLGVGILVWLSLESEPLAIEAAPVTSAEKRRLFDLIRSKSPTALEEDQIQTLRLTEQDLNVLLSWGLSIGSPQRKARIHLADNSASVLGSARVPLGTKEPRYLNLVLAGAAGIESGSLRLDVDRFQVGSLAVPPWLLGPLVSLAHYHLGRDRRTRPFLDATRQMAIGTDFVEFTYGALHLPPEFRRDLFGSGAASEEVLASTQAQIDHLLDVAERTPRSELSFTRCLETVFALARARSVQRDPVQENRAGIFALGVLLGHPRVGRLLGPVFVGDEDASIRRALYRVGVHGRSDWTKHFCVSAVLAVLSDAAVSGAAGLLKEEIDADTGGSGFSFADLLADHAGTAFALRATRDETSARALQDRLARRFGVEEVFPPAADLPEGIPDAQLQSQYGGVGGEGYRRLIEEIERRVAACAAYR